ncbi:MAG: bis(5'-nucleosyl)-tetraphosphatase (symmetrical) YqeK [Chloroflexi bacterium]|nr:bis(5'-nucleosyl)-tetraphosphatase (symmetrical) YqeK [Chloroflexota bacterium]
MTTDLPPSLIARLDSLPDGLRAHIERVRGIARDLAAAHGIDPATADLAAAAHDVARHIPGRMLIEEAERLGIAVNTVERAAPILLHGPVGAGWLREDGAIRDPEVLEGVHWHTTAHPDLAPVGQAVFVADKLDPVKEKAYPFQPEVRAAAERSLHDGVLAFLDGALRMHLARRELLHPMSAEPRNSLLIALSC